MTTQNKVAIAVGAIVAVAVVALLLILQNRQDDAPDSGTLVLSCWHCGHRTIPCEQLPHA